MGGLPWPHSSQSNGMAESYVQKIKRDYADFAHHRMHKPQCDSLRVGSIIAIRSNRIVPC